MKKDKYGVRDVLENKTKGISDVGYDSETGGVTGVVNGKTYNFGKNGFTLGEDERYRGSMSDIRNNFKAATGYKGVNDALASKGRNVYFNPDEQKLYVDGVGFNTENMVNIDGILYAADDEISKLMSSTEFKNPYSGLQAQVLEQLRSYGNFGYNPDNDKSLRRAQENAMRAVREDYGRRGLLMSSDAVLDGATRAAELVPQYENLAFNRYKSQKEDLFDLLESLMSLGSEARKNYDTDSAKSSNAGNLYEGIRQNKIGNQRKVDEAAYGRENDEKKLNFDREKFEYQKSDDNLKKEADERQEAWEQAYKRAKMTGVVSAADAPILGIPAGTYVK